MTGALVPSATTIESLPTAAQEAAISVYLENARDWLARAVTETGPEQIAAVKAEIATAAEATRQLHLSKEIQEDAVEMVRRAEYALGKAIRKGQEEGTVRSRNDGGRPSHRDVLPGEDREYKPGPADYAPEHELSSSQGGIYDLVDGVSDEAFEEALTDALEEHNPSRANVVRKIKTAKAKKVATDEPDRLTRIAEMAARGMSSRQMSDVLGPRDDYIRKIARDNGIEIPADAAISRTRRPNSDRAVQQLVLELNSLVGTVELVDVSAVSRDHVEEWANSLLVSLRALSKFANQLKKESTHS